MQFHSWARNMVAVLGCQLKLLAWALACIAGKTAVCASTSLVLLQATLTGNPTSQTKADLIDTKVWEKLGKMDTSKKERLGASHVVLHRIIGQELDERHEEVSGVGNSCHERELHQGQQLHAALPAQDDNHVKTLDIVSNAGEDERLEAWKRLVLELDPQAKPRAAGLMQRLPAFDLTRNIASFELSDKERLRLKQVTGIDIEDEVKCGLVTLHMQDDMLRHHLIMHASRLDMFSKRTRGGAGHRQSQRSCRR